MIASNTPRQDLIQAAVLITGVTTQRKVDQHSDEHELNEAQANYSQILWLMILSMFLVLLAIWTVSVAKAKTAEENAAKAEARAKVAETTATEAVAKATEAEAMAKNATERAEASDQQATLALVREATALKKAADAESQAKESEKQAEIAWSRVKDIEKTDKGQLYDEHEKLLINLQRQRLLEALDVIEQSEREKLSITLFKDDEKGLRMDHVIRVLVQGKIAEGFGGARFAEGCRHAQDCFATQDNRLALEKRWETDALSKTGMTTGGSKLRIMKQRDAITPENKEWLSQEVAKRVGKLAEDTRALHGMAMYELSQYYAKNASEIDDDAVTALLDRFEELLDTSEAQEKESTAEALNYLAELAKQREAMVAKVDDAITNYVRGVFDKNGTPLLHSEWGSQKEVSHD